MSKITSTEQLDGYTDAKEGKGYHPPNDQGPVDFLFKTSKEAHEDTEYQRGYREGKKKRK